MQNCMTTVDQQYVYVYVYVHHVVYPSHCIDKQLLQNRTLIKLRKLYMKTDRSVHSSADGKF